MNEYLDNLNNSSVYKNDHKLAESYEILEWDPKNILQIKGGIIPIVAPTGSGKTFLLKDILKNIKDNFVGIYMFSRTAKLQDELDFMPRGNISDEFNEELLKSIWTNQTKTSKPVLVILDDVVNDKQYKTSKTLDDIAMGGRHKNILVLLLSQGFTQVKYFQRINSRMAISFQLPSKKERLKFVEQFMSMENSRVGDMLYKKLTGEKYQCVIVEHYKVGCPEEEKIFKYKAKPVKVLKIKSIEYEPQSFSKADIELKIKPPEENWKEKRNKRF